MQVKSDLSRISPMLNPSLGPLKQIGYLRMINQLNIFMVGYVTKFGKALKLMI